jgi:UDP-glucose 6-dehydrogenase
MMRNVDAVVSLRPGAQFVMYDEDVENITWHTEGVTPLTQAEVDAEVARLEQKAIDDAAAHEAALESAQAKLLALGLTEDEVAAMTSG